MNTHTCAQLYKIIVEHCDGRSTLHKGLEYDEAITKAEEWLGRSFSDPEKKSPEKSTTVASAVSDHGGNIFVERNISDNADQMWDVVNYSWRTKFEEIQKMREEGDEYLQLVLKDMSEEDMKQGLKELEEVGFIKPDKVEDEHSRQDEKNGKS